MQRTTQKRKIIMSKYTQLKVFHYKERIDNLKSNKIMSPVHVRIKPTNVCNHRCSYCAYKNPDLQLGQDMILRDFIPRDKMIEIVKDLKDMRVEAATFSGGGEPLCYPYILETLKALKEANIKIGMLTNGALLKGEAAEFLAANASWVRVSMDGWNDDSYKSFRGVADYNNIIANLKKFKDYNRICVLGVSLIINKDNASHIFDMIKKLHAIGVDNVKVSPVIISNDAETTNKYHEPLRKIVNEQIDKAKKSFPSLEVFDAYHQLGSFQKDYAWCPFQQLLIVIGADQKVYPCQDKAYNNQAILGDLKNQSFKQFWCSDKNNFFKIRPNKDCINHCVADNKNLMIIEYLNTEHREFV
jgi:MoaA/NifB/PqqE/SkfB family radical SAM enzyme